MFCELLHNALLISNISPLVLIFKTSSFTIVHSSANIHIENYFIIPKFFILLTICNPSECKQFNSLNLLCCHVVIRLEFAFEPETISPLLLQALSFVLVFWLLCLLVNMCVSDCVLLQCVLVTVLCVSNRVLNIFFTLSQAHCHEHPEENFSEKKKYVPKSGTKQKRLL